MKSSIQIEQRTALEEFASVWGQTDIPDRVRMLRDIFSEQFKGFNREQFYDIAANIILPKTDVVQARTIIKSTLDTPIHPKNQVIISQLDRPVQTTVIKEDKPVAAKPEVKQPVQAMDKKTYAQKQLEEKTKKREAQRMRILRGLRVLKSEWKNLSETQRAGRLNNLNKFGSCDLKANAGEILGLSEKELNKYIEKGRGLRSDEVFLDTQGVYHCERGNSRY